MQQMRITPGVLGGEARSGWVHYRAAGKPEDADVTRPPRNAPVANCASAASLGSACRLRTPLAPTPVSVPSS